MIINPTQAQIDAVQAVLGPNAQLQLAPRLLPWFEGASAAEREVKVLQYRKCTNPGSNPLLYTAWFDVPDDTI